MKPSWGGPRLPPARNRRPTSSGRRGFGRLLIAALMVLVPLTVRADFQLYVTTVGNGSVITLNSASAESTLGSGLNTPQALAFGPNGDLFVVNGGNSTISEITPAGVVSTFASGLNNPQGLAFDRNGNLFVANGGNGTITEITPAGVVSTFISGFGYLQGLAFDGHGNLYVTENNTVIAVTPAGYANTFASGFNEPAALAFDGNGNFYVANAGNSTISKVTPDGVASTFASISSGFSSLAFDDAGNLYAAENGDIWRITPDGVVSQFPAANLGSVNYLATASTPAVPAITRQPSDQTVAAGTNISLTASVGGAPWANSFQWQRLPSGGSTWANLTTTSNYLGTTSPSLIVGNATFSMTGDQFRCIVTNAVGPVVSNSATLSVAAVAIGQQPSDQAVVGNYGATFSVGATGAGLRYQWKVSTNGGGTWNSLSDDSNQRGSATPSLGLSNTSASMTGYEYECVITSDFGSNTTTPASLTVLPFRLLVSNSNGDISQISPSGVVSSLAPGAIAQPAGLAFDPEGNLYVGNSSNSLFVINPQGAVGLFATGGFYYPAGLAFDAGGNLYVANSGNGSVAVVTPSGLVSAFASGMSEPEGMAMDGNGNLYVANFFSGTIARITPAGTVSTYATGFNKPTGLAFDGSGDLYVTNTGNTQLQNGGDTRVSMIKPNGEVSTYATGFNGPLGLAFDAGGNLYVANYFTQSVMVVAPGGAVSTFAANLSAPNFLAVISSPAAPAIITQPANQTAGAGAGSASFFVAVSGAPGLNSFQWQRLPAGNTTWENLADGTGFQGSATPTLTVSNASLAMSGDQFRCVATNVAGSGTSNPASLTVLPVYIYSPPSDDTVVSSYAATFSVGASGTNLSYQWRVSTNSGLSWSSLANDATHSGTTSSMLTVDNPLVGGSGEEFECVVTSDSGSTTSNPATLTVVPFLFYVSNFNGTVSKVTADGTTSQFASGFTSPVGLAVDADANLYIANQGNGTISKVTPGGSVSRFASGLQQPAGLAFDANGNLYVSNQSSNNTISSITPAGVVSTYASGLSGPASLAFDSSGNLYVSHQANGNITKVTPAGVASTFATGFVIPQGMAFDGGGNLLVNWGGNSTISKITPGGVVSQVVSGLGSQSGGLVVGASGNMYAATINNKLDQITPGGVVSQFALIVFGSRAAVAIVTPPLAAPVIGTQPQSQVIATGQNANLTIIASGPHGSNIFQWQRLPAGGSVWTTLTDGGAYSGSLGPTLTVAPVTPAMSGDQFRCVVTNSIGSITSNVATITVQPVDITVQPQDQTVASSNGAVFSTAAAGVNLTYQWQVSTDGGATWTNLANNPTYAGTSTNTLTISNTTLAMLGYKYENVITSDFGASPTNPATLSVQPFLMYVANSGNGTVSQITASGVVTTFASGFNGTEGVAFDGTGNLFVAASGNGSVFRVTPGGVVSTFVTTPKVNRPQGLAFDARGNLLVASGTTVAKITPAGATSGFGGGFSSPTGLVFDSSGYLNVAYQGTLNAIGPVSPDDHSNFLYGGFSNPAGLAIDANGNLYVANQGNGTVSVVTPAWSISTFASGFNSPVGLAFDGNGNLYVVNQGNGTVSKVTPAGVVSTFVSGLSSPTYIAIDTVAASPTVAPAITMQPQRQSILAGAGTTFYTQASSAPNSITFQWQRFPVAGSGWINLTDDGNFSGSNTSTLSLAFAPLAMSGDQFQCVITNSAGGLATNPATLTVNPLTGAPSFSEITFAAWQSVWFTAAQLNDPGTSGSMGMPASDGVTNFIKYAFNLDPYMPPGTNGNPDLPEATLANGNLTLNFSARSSVTYTVQASTDLVNWSTQGVTIQANGQFRTASHPIPATGSIFLRVLVQSN